MKVYKSFPSLKDERNMYKKNMLLATPVYCREIKYEELEPKDVPVKAYWLNWSTTT